MSISMFTETYCLKPRAPGAIPAQSWARLRAAAPRSLSRGVVYPDIIRLENDEPEIVHRMIGFMYRSGPRLFPAWISRPFWGLVKIYLLAVRFDIPPLEF